MAHVGTVEKGPWARSLRAVLNKKKSGPLRTALARSDVITRSWVVLSLDTGCSLFLLSSGCDSSG